MHVLSDTQNISGVDISKNTYYKKNIEVREDSQKEHWKE